MSALENRYLVILSIKLGNKEGTRACWEKEVGRWSVHSRLALPIEFPSGCEFSAGQ